MLVGTTFGLPSAAMQLSRSSVAALFAVVSFSFSAHADLLPENMTYAPVKLSLDGQEAFADASLVVQNCSKTGGHAFTIAKPGETLECRTVKRPLDVRAVPKKELKPLEELYAANKGWAVELGEAEKLLAKAPSCGKVEVSALVERAKNIDHILAKYAVAKAGAGCSLKKIELTNVTRDAVGGTASGAASGAAPPAADAGGAVAAASDGGSAPAPSSAIPTTPSAATTPASSAPAVASGPPAATPVKTEKSGCAMVACAPRTSLPIAALAFVLGAIVLRRRIRVR